ncbi:MAG: four helix bundle protein [Verrucomicrobiales bacterium]
MKVERFEDLRIWQEARVQVRSIYKSFDADSPAGRDFTFLDQIRRAATSVMNNIAEGFERNSDNQFSHFLTIAKGSNGEVRSMLYVAEDLGYCAPAFANEAREFSENLSKGIASFIQYLRSCSGK